MASQWPIVGALSVVQTEQPMSFPLSNFAKVLIASGTRGAVRAAHGGLGAYSASIVFVSGT